VLASRGAIPTADFFFRWDVESAEFQGVTCGNAVGFERDIEGVLKAVRAEYNLNTEVKDTGNPFGD
jgi:hypothetical protein